MLKINYIQVDAYIKSRYPAEKRTWTQVQKEASAEEKNDYEKRLKEWPSCMLYMCKIYFVRL